MDSDAWKDIQPIEKIEFGIFGYDEMNIVKIGNFANNGGFVNDDNSIEIVDLYENCEPRRGSLIDPRGGTKYHNDIDHYSYSCAICGLRHNFGEAVHPSINMNDNIQNTQKKQQEYTYLNISENMRIVL
jgi:hypothetical protein